MPSSVIDGSPATELFPPIMLLLFMESLAPMKLFPLSGINAISFIKF